MVARVLLQPLDSGEGAVDAFKGGVIPPIGPSVEEPREVKFLELQVIQHATEATHETVMEPSVVLVSGSVDQVKVTAQQLGPGQLVRMVRSSWRNAALSALTVGPYMLDSHQGSPVLHSGTRQMVAENLRMQGDDAFQRSRRHATTAPPAMPIAGRLI